MTSQLSKIDEAPFKMTRHLGNIRRVAYLDSIVPSFDRSVVVTGICFYFPHNCFEHTVTGTPSLAEPETIGAVVDGIKNLVSFSSCSEITIEVNPTDLEISKLRYVYLTINDLIFKSCQFLNVLLTILTTTTTKTTEKGNCVLKKIYIYKYHDNKQELLLICIHSYLVKT